MSFTETKYFTSGAAPDPLLSGGGCSWDPAYTGADCIAQSTCPACAVARDSVRFSGLEQPVYQDDYDLWQLKVGWDLSMTCPDGGIVTAYIQYSLVSPFSTWYNFSGFPRTTSGSGTATASISVGQAYNTIRIRTYVEAVCDDFECPTQCTGTFDITNVRAVGTYEKGACCNPNTGQCNYTTQSLCSHNYQGDGTDCDPNPCPPPAEPPQRQILFVVI